MVFISFILTFNSNIDLINKCLSSFVHQSFKDYEIICINNILDEEKLASINVYMNKKMHILSKSPDTYEKVIGVTKGNYVCFINPEFVLKDSNTLEKIVPVIKEHSDKDMFSTFLQFPQTKYITDSYNIFEYNPEDYPFNLSLFNNIFKKEIFLNNKFEFDKINLHNEKIFFVEILTKINNLIIFPIDFCQYVDDTTLFNNDSKKLISLYQDYKDLLYLLTKNDKYCKLLEKITNNILKNNYVLPNFSIEEYNELNENWIIINDILKKNPFNSSHEINKKLRYMKEMIEKKVKKYDIGISIIIPTYNVEDYIGECLNSLIIQSFDAFEIIIVDDLSTDSTVEVIEYYSQKDSRIKLFKNDRKRGSGGSRNFGLKHARGKYIQFVDGDDWLDSNSLEYLYNYAEKFDTQLLMFKSISYNDSNKSYFKDDYLSIIPLNKYNNKVFNFNQIYEELFEISVSPVNKLYLASFLDDVGAKFTEKYIHQDNPFFYQVFCEAEKIYLADEYFYNRRVWEGSITTLRDDTELGTIEIVEEILKVFINNGLYKKFKKLLLNRLLFKLRNRYTLVGDDFKETYFIRSKKKLYKFMFDYGLYDDLIDSLSYENRKYFDRIVYSKNFEEFLNGFYTR